MKKITLSFIIALITISACKKEKGPTPMSTPHSSTSIVASWNLIKNVSNTYLNDSLTESDVTYVPLGEVQMQFNPDGTFLELEGGDPVEFGTYTFNSNVLTLMNDTDTIVYTANLPAPVLILVNIQYDIWGTDTTKYETELTFDEI